MRLYFDSEFLTAAARPMPFGVFGVFGVGGLSIDCHGSVAEKKLGDLGGSSGEKERSREPREFGTSRCECAGDRGVSGSELLLVGESMHSTVIARFGDRGSGPASQPDGPSTFSLAMPFLLAAKFDSRM